MRDIVAHLIALAQESPSRPAIQEPEATVSYAALVAQASRMAALLARAQLAPGSAVAVIGDLSTDTVTTYLGVLMAGCHYVPIASDTPLPRTTMMLDNSHASLAVWTTQPTMDLPVESVQFSVAMASADNSSLAAVHARDDALHQTLCLMFTSGSAGVPKPVLISEAAVLATFADATSCMSILPGDRVLARSTVAFDAATFEVWGTWLAGGCIVLLGVGKAGPREIGQTIVDRGVTVALLPAALFPLVLEQMKPALEALRLLVVGGDVMPVTAARTLLAGASAPRLVNAYGPTEATVISTVMDVHEWDPTQGVSVPVGRPYPHTELYVLDEHLRPVVDGARGELYIGGPRLATGYLGRARRTAESFLPDPFSSVPGSRMYRTGDLVRWNGEQMLEFTGRADDEVKVSGYRVNLAEVDAALQAVVGVESSATVAVAVKDTRELVSFVQLDGTETGKVKRSLATMVSRHLVPQHLHALDSLPLMGEKVDRAALRTMAAEFVTSAPPKVTDTDDASQETPLEVLADGWTSMTGTEPSEDADFFLAGGSSLDLMRLTNELRLRAGVVVPFAELYAAESYAHMKALVAEAPREEEFPK